MTTKTTTYLALAGWLSLMLPLPAAQAEDEEKTSTATKLAVSGALFGAEKLGKWVAGQYYKDFRCAAEDREGWSFICSALHDFSGGKESEWKENVTHQLSAIRDDLAAIKQGQAVMQNQLNDLVSQNHQLLAKVDELVDESVIQPDLRKIQALWSDQFVPLYINGTSFSRDRLLAFAREVVRDQKIHMMLGSIGKTLTSRGVGSKPPLLRLYANRLKNSLEDTLKNSPDPRLKRQIASGHYPMLLESYRYLEGVMADLLLEQRKGYLMYQFAAEVLESECQRQECGADGPPPIPAQAYEKIFADQLAQELDAFNEAVEWLVLATSDPLACNADFLPDQASEIFWRADWLTAVTLGRFGLTGRVISMGNRFDGQLRWSPHLQTGSTPLPLAPSQHAAIKVDGPPLDWWVSGQNTLVFDEIHFSDEWRIFRYQQADWKTGLYSLDTQLPDKPFTVPVATMDLTTGLATEAPPSDTVAVFGSFVAVQRAGGCYALTSGPWVRYDNSDPRQPGFAPPGDAGIAFGMLPASTVNAIKQLLLNGQVEIDYNGGGTSETPLAVGVESRGKVRWVMGNLGKRQSAEWVQEIMLETQKKIRYPEARSVAVGGNLILNAELNPDDRIKGAPNPGVRDEDYSPPDVVLGMKTDFGMGGIGPKPAEYQGRVALVFGDPKSHNGLVWEHTEYFRKPDTFVLAKRKDSHGVLLKADQSYPLRLSARTYVKQEPKGTTATSWMIKAKAMFDKVYLSLPK